MNYNFWKEKIALAESENRPLVVLAPMADVTDVAFRSMIAKYSRTGQVGGGPDVMWTEFVSADGLSSSGREVLRRDLEFTEAERPIVAQLFSSRPENMKKAVAYCKSLGFDGVDINMGCPDRNIEKQGCGAAMIKNPELAKEVILAAKEAAGEMPISVKTRIGYNTIDYKDWLTAILSTGVPVLTVHLRTRKEMSKVSAHWELFKEIQEFCHSIAPDTFIIGNGDVYDLQDAQAKYDDPAIAVKGVMIGRGVFGTPWRFDWQQTGKEKSIKERLIIMLEHTKVYEEKLGDIKNFAIMKKHYKAYVNGFDGAGELRGRLMEAKDYLQIEEIINTFLKSLK